jgi:tetratricopeptide (TPR) repeat protein
MSFLKFLSGPTSEKLEEKGDELLNSGSWGEAKLKYEQALEKAQKEGDLTRSRTELLSLKITKTKEALAKAHRETAQDLIEGGYYEDARSYISLAFEVTSDKALIEELTMLTEKLESLQQVKADEELAEEYYGLADEGTTDEPHETTLDEQYHAVCGTLPPEIQEIYLSYGENFKAGYLALNSGDFETAATYLSLAMAEDSNPAGYIPMELATAYMHLGKLPEARELLLPVLKHHPETLPVYQLLCDIYWEEKEFGRADALIDSVPEKLADSIAVLLLRGETRYHAGDYEEAKTLYQTFLDSRGWENEVAIALAKVHEASGEGERARNIYSKIMGRCTGCGAKIDPEIKHKYAELCFTDGIHDSSVLELYLSLAQETPHNAPVYYERVSRIYAARGNETEATRFRSIAKRVASGEKGVLPG